MFSPALIRYIVDPENPHEHKDKNAQNPIKKSFSRVNTVDLANVKEEFGFLQAVFLKIRAFFSVDKNFEIH